jgi:hypothetical protein
LSVGVPIKTERKRQIDYITPNIIYIDEKGVSLIKGIRRIKWNGGDLIACGLSRLKNSSTQIGACRVAG